MFIIFHYSKLHREYTEVNLVKKTNTKFLIDAGFKRPSEKPTNKKWKCFTYINDSVSSRLSNIIRSAGHEIAYKTNNSLKAALCKYKDKIDIGQASGVYEISCDNCNAIFGYIGQTSRKLSDYIKEHV